MPRSAESSQRTGVGKPSQARYESSSIPCSLRQHQGRAGGRLAISEQRVTHFVEQSTDFIKSWDCGSPARRACRGIATAGADLSLDTRLERGQIRRSSERQDNESRSPAASVGSGRSKSEHLNDRTTGRDTAPTKVVCFLFTLATRKHEAFYRDRFDVLESRFQRRDDVVFILTNARVANVRISSGRAHSTRGQIDDDSSHSVAVHPKCE